MTLLLQALSPENEALGRFLLIAMAACFGATVGSFLNVCVYRIPRNGLRVGKPARSFCPICGSGIAWHDNIPVISWFALGGRCRSCRAPIALRYPLVETLTAVLFAIVADRFIFEFGGSLVGLVFLLVLTSALIVGSFVDFDLRLLPDEITVGGMHVLPLMMVALPELRFGIVEDSVCRFLVWLRDGLAPLRDGVFGGGLESTGATWAVIALAMIASFVAGCVIYRAYRRKFLPEDPRRFRDVSLAGVLSAAAVGLIVAIVVRPEWTFSRGAYSLTACLLGMLSGSVLIFAIGELGSRVFRKPAMGFGDVKLMGLLGGLTGWSGALLGVLGACILGSIWGIARFVITRDRYLPFGPFLTIACFVLYLWPGFFPTVFSWYLGLF